MYSKQSRICLSCDYIVSKNDPDHLFCEDCLKERTEINDFLKKQLI